MIRACLVAAALLIAACAPTSEPGSDADAVASGEAPVAAGPQTAEEATAQDTCGAAAFQSLVGTPAADIDASTLPAGARIITPEMMVTQDIRPDRLNINVGTDGLVGSLSCF